MRVWRLFDAVRAAIGGAPGADPVPLGAHFHNTRGTGIASAFAAVQVGVTQLDASVGGLGGCPFAPGASGNIATEELVYLLDDAGITTGVDLDAVLAAAAVATELVGHPVGEQPVPRRWPQPAAAGAAHGVTPVEPSGVPRAAVAWGMPVAWLVVLTVLLFGAVLGGLWWVARRSRGRAGRLRSPDRSRRSGIRRRTGPGSRSRSRTSGSPRTRSPAIHRSGRSADPVASRRP